MKNGIFKLYELRDEMKKGITNIEEVVSQQEELLKVVKASKKSKTLFKEFVTGLEGQIKNTKEEQLVTLHERLDIIEKLIKDYESSDNKKQTEDLITSLFIGLGILNLSDFTENTSTKFTIDPEEINKELKETA